MSTSAPDPPRRLITVRKHHLRSHHYHIWSTHLHCPEQATLVLQGCVNPSQTQYIPRRGYSIRALADISIHPSYFQLL